MTLSNSEPLEASTPVPEITLSEFARLFPLRAPRIGFLLGAGASVTSGIPSAWDLIWAFKREIYAGDQKLNVKSLGPLADPSVRSSIQRHFDSQHGAPAEGADNEYSFYFKRAYPDPDDRRLYVSQLVKDRQPHFGYLCLGALLVNGKARFVWTPNFDTMVEQSYSIISGGETPAVLGRDTSHHLRIHIRDERFPVVMKLHGDFRVDPLQNTEEELAALDSGPSDEFVEFAGSYGLVVVGYSGRDASVMNAIDRALNEHGPRAFPQGLYWCLREQDNAPTRAVELLSAARAIGSRAAFVRITDWDDFATALYRSCGLSHPRVDSELAAAQRHRTGYALSTTGSAEPILKLNAIPISSYPDSCFRFTSNIPNWEALRAVVAGHDVVAALFRKQVYALGTRTEIQRIFAEHGIEELQPTPIREEDLRVSRSIIIGMFYEALSRALAVPPTLRLGGSSRHRLLYFSRNHGLPQHLTSLFATAELKAGREVVRHVKNKGYWAHEAIQYSLDYRESRLWMLVSPTVVLTADGEDTRWEDPARMDIVRESLVERHNRQSSDLLTFWLKVLQYVSTQGTVRFPPGTEIGFEFRLENRLGTSFRRS